MPSPLRFAAALPPLFLLFQAQSARAQAGASITIAADPERTTPAGTTASPSSLGPNVVNYSDCIHDESLTFSLAAKGVTVGDKVEAWAGEGAVDCADVVNRTAATAQCWRVGIVDSASTSMMLKVRVQDVLSQFGRPTKSTSANGDAKACGILSAGPHALTLHFMTIDGTNAVGTGATYALVAETVFGAAAPSFTVAGGNAGATIRVSDAGNLAITGYDVYCDPLPNDTRASDAGAQGVSGIGPPNMMTQCSSSTLIAQRGFYGLQNPYPGPPPSGLGCGKIAADATTTTISGLASGVTYAIAIAPTDAYGNHGTLGGVECATTQAAPTDDWNECAMSPGPKRTSLATIAFGLVAAVIARLRRKRAPSV